jgi:ribonuclease Z
MTPLLHPSLVNDRFGDPALYVEFLFEKRALLFDLGDLHALEPRKILRLSDLFVSHTHLDHFIGFDQILRVLIGREKLVRLYGPAGFIDHVAHRLGSYSWNLVDRYSSELVFSVTEVESGSRARKAEFRLGNAFRREAEQAVMIRDGIILDDGVFKARAAVLDHRIPCLAFAIEEKAHVNVWKNRLDQLGLPTGAWLRDLKQAVLRDEPNSMAFRAWWREAGELRERVFPLGQLKEEILEIVPGQKIGYVVDALFNDRNRRHIVDLVSGADILFIEAAFAKEDAERAAARYHLTTEQAGRLARLAGVERLEPFHFSPRYAGEEERLRDEVERAFHGRGS